MFENGLKKFVIFNFLNINFEILILIIYLCEYFQFQSIGNCNIYDFENFKTLSEVVVKESCAQYQNKRTEIKDFKTFELKGKKYIIYTNAFIL